VKLRKVPGSVGDRDAVSLVTFVKRQCQVRRVSI
jgi:hypothetical protein